MTAKFYGSNPERKTRECMRSDQVRSKRAHNSNKLFEDLTIALHSYGEGVAVMSFPLIAPEPFWASNY